MYTCTHRLNGILVPLTLQVFSPDPCSRELKTLNISQEKGKTGRGQEETKVRVFGGNWCSFVAGCHQPALKTFTEPHPFLNLQHTPKVRYVVPFDVSPLQRQYPRRRFHIVWIKSFAESYFPRNSILVSCDIASVKLYIYSKNFIVVSFQPWEEALPCKSQLISVFIDKVCVAEGGYATDTVCPPPRARTQLHRAL